MRGGPQALSKNQKIAALLGLFTLLGLALRIPSLNDSLIWDELSTHYVVFDRSFGGMLDMVRGEQEITPPLYFAVAWLFSQFGDPSLTLRLPSLIAGLATIPLTYLLGAWTVGRKAGLVGALLVAVSPFMIFYSTEARPYGLLICLTLLSTISLIAAVRENRVRWWIAFAFFAAASMYTHYTALFVLLAETVWALAYFKELRVRILMAVAGSAVLFLPWLPDYLSDSDSPGSGVIESIQPFTADAVRLDISQWGLGHPFIPRTDLPGTTVRFLLVIGLAIAVAGLLRELWLRRGEPFFWRPNRWVVLVIALALAAPVIAAIVSFVDVSVYLPRNLVTSSPGLAVAVGALSMASRVPALRITSAGLIILYFAFAAVSMFDDQYQRPDYKGAAALIARESRPGDRIVESPPLQAGPVSSLDVPLDELREAKPDIPEVDRIGIPARDASDAALQPGGEGRYAPIPIESESSVAKRTGDLEGSERLFVVSPGADPLESVRVYPEAPLARYFDALPKNVKVVQADTFPGFNDGVSVIVLEKVPGS